VRRHGLHPYRVVTVEDAGQNSSCNTHRIAGGRSGKVTPETSEPDAATDLIGFTSRSGDVGCIIESAYVRCDISGRLDFPAPARRL
jgi:hypothetical protein